jgi:hypothetical protein
VPLGYRFASDHGPAATPSRLFQHQLQRLPSWFSDISAIRYSKAYLHTKVVRDGHEL